MIRISAASGATLNVQPSIIINEHSIIVALPNMPLPVLHAASGIVETLLGHLSLERLGGILRSVTALRYLTVCALRVVARR